MPGYQTIFPFSGNAILTDSFKNIFDLLHALKAESAL
jgi:hypothetical protein